MNNVLTKDNKSLPYKIINKNNKNTYFRVKPNYLEISKSKYLKNSEVLSFALKNFDKFYNKYLEISKTNLSNQIVLEEITYNLIIIKDKDFSYEAINNNIYVKTKLENIDKIKHLIYLNHLKEMVIKLSDRVLNVLNKNQIKELKYKYGYYKTKFGSYHKINNEITLNIVLAKYNINYLYYVIMHEYAHTVIFNHSKAFYKELEKLMPNYLTYHKTIKKLSIWI